MNELIIHSVNITHYRLVELSKLADQAKPFYDWVEKMAKKVTGSHKSLNDILLKTKKNIISEIILKCYNENDENKPLLFDGIGRVYNHSKACFYFFAWIIRDAPQQRLTPLISRMRKADNKYYMTAVIIAQNWSSLELGNIDDQIDLIFHFDMSPNKFVGFDDSAQIKLNKYVEEILNGNK